MTTKFQREKEQLQAINKKMDAGADSLLDKLKASKWTGAAVIAAGITAVFLLIK